MGRWVVEDDVLKYEPERPRCSLRAAVMVSQGGFPMPLPRTQRPELLNQGHRRPPGRDLDWRQQQAWDDRQQRRPRRQLERAPADPARTAHGPAPAARGQRTQRSTPARTWVCVGDGGGAGGGRGRRVAIRNNKRCTAIVSEPLEVLREGTCACVWKGGVGWGVMGWGGAERSA